MNIGTKLTSGFLLVAILIAVVGYLAIGVLERASLDAAGRTMADQVAVAMHMIDKRFKGRLDGLEGYAEIAGLAEQVQRANQAMDGMSRREEFIATIDADWVDGKETPAIQAILNNDVSDVLKQYSNYSVHEQGYPIFTEMYVLNKYGGVLGAAQRNYRYAHARETWHQEASARKGTWIGQVRYDTSANSVGLDMTVSLLDADGNFVGLLVAFLNIEDTQCVVTCARHGTRLKLPRISLVDRSGRAVLNKSRFLPSQSKEDLELEAFGQDVSRRRATEAALKGKDGYEVIEDKDGDVLVAFSHSRVRRQDEVLDWTLLAEYDVAELLAPVYVAKQHLLQVAMAIAAIAILYGLVLSRSISHPIKELTAIAVKIAGGERNIDAKKLEGNDEVGILAKSFNQMTRELTMANAGLRERATELEKMNASVRAEQDHLRTLLEATDRERKLVAYEIHDGLAQHLVAANMYLQTFAGLKKGSTPQAEETLAAVNQFIDRSISEARRLISGLRPPILDEQGIVAAVNHLVCDQTDPDGPEVGFVSQGEFDDLQPLLANACYRIIQESLTNAYRYSSSEEVRIELTQVDSRIQIDVTDWGVGFDPDDIGENCFGLRGIQERARLLGGKADVQSALGEGTRVSVWLPLLDNRG